MKKVLITGAGSGLGRALAERYSANGDEVCLVDMNIQAAQEVADAINKSNDESSDAFALACDITKQSDVDALAHALLERWGCVDVLVNNAGVATAGSIESESLEQWQWVMDINVLGHVRMTKAILPLIRGSHNSDRSIINIASQAGLTSAPGMGSYSVTKAAMVSFSETTYLELIHEDIWVSAVCPAFFDTNLNTSLRTDDAGMQGVVTKLIKKSGISAEQIADKIIAGVAARKFLILTHKEGIKAYRLKRFLPIERYLKMIQSRTKKFVNPPK